MTIEQFEAAQKLQKKITILQDQIKTWEKGTEFTDTQIHIKVGSGYSTISTKWIHFGTTKENTLRVLNEELNYLLDQLYEI